MNVAPVGSAPTDVMPVIGSVDEVVTLCVKAASSGTLNVATLVMVGAPPTVSVNVCVAFGNTPLLEVNVQVCTPASAVVGLPESVPPPLASAAKVTEGSAGEQAPKLAVGVGMPFAAKANVLAWVGMKMTLLALVMAGARVLPMVTVATAESAEPSLTLNVKLSLPVASALAV